MARFKDQLHKISPALQTEYKPNDPSAPKERVYTSCHFAAVHSGQVNPRMEAVPLGPNDPEDQAKIYLSRARYGLNDHTALKRATVAHEIFRRAGIEGDWYNLSAQIRFADPSK